MELLNEPNKAITKNLFLTSLKDSNKTIKLNIVGVGNVFKSKMNNKPNMFIDFNICSNFECNIIKLNVNNEPEKDSNGNEIIIKENVFNNIVSLPYNLTETRQDNYYKISNRSNLFNILNYALIKNKKINGNNTKGFNISIKEIQENLLNLSLFVKCVLVTDTNYKPYLKLIVVDPPENETL